MTNSHEGQPAVKANPHLARFGCGASVGRTWAGRLGNKIQNPAESWGPDAKNLVWRLPQDKARARSASGLADAGCRRSCDCWFACERAVQAKVCR